MELTCILLVVCIPVVVIGRGKSLRDFSSSGYVEAVVTGG